MDVNEAAEYIEMIDKLKGKYKLKFSPSKQKFGLQEIEEDSSKVMGMLLGNTDYLVTFALFCDDILDVPFGGGLEVGKRLCDCDSTEFNRFLDLVKNGMHYGDVKLERRCMREAESDLSFLRDSEKLLYKSGLVLPECNAYLNIY